MDQQQPEDSVIQRTSATTRYTFKDIHDALFPSAPDARPITDFDEGIRELMRRKHPPRGPHTSAKRVC